MLLLALAVAVTACGKKGPPLAPLIKVPVAPPETSAKRVGAIACVQLQVPATNSDGTRPADVRRVEVYGFTGAVPTAADVVKHGTVVASIPVRPPATEEETSKAGAAGDKTPPPPSMANGFDQGNVLTVTETLGPAQSAPVEIPVRGKAAPVPFTDEWQPRLQPPAKKGDTRVYFAVGVNHKGRRGAFSPPLLVPLGPAPSAPSAPKATYDPSGITLEWTAPPDVPQPIQRPAAEGELESKPLGVRSAVGGFNVYEAAPQPPASPAAESAVPAVAAAPVSKALNDKLLEKAVFTDPHIEFGRERCFVVRTALQYGTAVIESAPSPVVCVTPADTFPPAAPKGLAAVASEGAISLIWEANTDADLAGYLVMRAEPGQEAKAVTPEPIKETTFRDATASRGVRYVYTVVAVDTAGNRSVPSNAVEETAR